MSIFGSDFICTEDWDIESLHRVISLAAQMKKSPFDPKWQSLLKNKSFLMLFYNPSLRTHLSFETAVSELGGHSIYRTPEMSWVKTKNGISSSEALKDIAKVASRYVDGIGIRILMNAIAEYGQGNQFLLDFAKYSDVPIVSMADDKFHPCQGLADIMGWTERFSPTTDVTSLKGKTLLLTWGSSGFARPWASVQSHLLLASRFGMNIKLAYPLGYELDPEVRQLTRLNCQSSGASYQELHEPSSGYEGTDVVYVRNWITKGAYNVGEFQYEKEIKQSLTLATWKVTEEKMKRSNKAIFSNPMPIDRAKEADDDVIDSDYSVIYDVAENRKHVQKALLALIMGAH